MAPMHYPYPIFERRSVRVGWRHKCHRCGQLFNSKRSDAAACSPACSRALYRAGLREKRDASV